MFPLFLAIFLLGSSGIASSAALPKPQDEQDSGILSYQYTNSGQGDYRFSYETIDHMRREETGTLIRSDSESSGEYIQVIGSYSYIRPDGQIETVRYIADKDGYKVLPPLPPPVEDIPLPVVATLLGK